MRAARGAELSCKGWVQEAALRMLHNNLDPEVAERPDDLVVYGGTGKAARSWEAFDVIARELRDARERRDAARPVGQGGRPLPHPRRRAARAHRELEPRGRSGRPGTSSAGSRRSGLTMYGQMTAGSWIYIGTQGILQGTYETFVAARKAHDGAHRRRRRAAGSSPRGSAAWAARSRSPRRWPGCRASPSRSIPTRIEKRLETRYVDERIDDLDEALARDRGVARAKSSRGRSPSARNAADIYPGARRSGASSRISSPSRPPRTIRCVGYIPHRPHARGGGRASRRGSRGLRRARQGEHGERGRGDARACKKAGAEVFDYGNNIRACAKEAGCERAFDIPGFVPAYIRPLFCAGQGPVPLGRALRRSGGHRASPIEAVLDAVPDDPDLRRWIELAQERVEFQGLPARICWLGYGDRAKVGLAFNELVRTGKVKAPIVIGRDHLDCGSVASPNRETEAMKDGSDAIADWRDPQRARQHRGRRVLGELSSRRRRRHRHIAPRGHGRRRRRHRKREAPRARAHERSGMGVIRHADAGYEEAIEFGRGAGVHLLASKAS